MLSCTGVSVRAGNTRNGAVESGERANPAQVNVDHAVNLRVGRFVIDC